MRKQKTFQGRYAVQSEAIEWLSSLARCFKIRKVSLRTYIKETEWTETYCCQVIVKYE